MYQSFSTFLKHTIKHQATETDFFDLKRAIAFGDAAKARALLDRFPALIEHVDLDGYNAALTTFLLHPHREILAVLLEKNAPVNAEVDDQGNTVLHLLAPRTERVMLEAFHHVEVFVDARNHHGRTPFSIAAENSNIEAMQWLQEEGANVAAKDRFGKSPLLWAVTEGWHSHAIDAIHQLLEWGANPNDGDNQGVTPLMEAVRCNRAEVVRLMLGYGGDPLMKLSRHDYSAFMLACMAGQLGMITLLLEHDVPPNPPLSQHRSLFHLLAAVGKPEVLDLLASRGGEVNVTNNDGEIPLHIAVSEGRTEMVATLMQYGADPLHPNAAGITPLDIARDKGATSIISLLVPRD